VFEGDGRVEEYVGGYEDWLRQRGTPSSPAVPAADSKPKTAAPTGPVSVPKKLSYKEQREFDALPARIEALETEQSALGARIADPKFYQEPAATIAQALERAQQIDRELAELYARWDALDSRST
jgi:ATP-binding cassette subfamily F protein uup